MADKPEAGSLTEAMPTDALKNAGQQLLSLLVQRAAQAASERVGGLSDRLSGVAENGGTGLRSALTGRDDSDEDEGDSGGDSGGGGWFSSLKDKVKGAFGAGGKGGGKGKRLKVTNIVESTDIGLPLRTTYDLWTRFEDFPGFMKKVESVSHDSDEKTQWKAQVLWSHRTWEATVLEQVPDSHIVWQSKGAKGHVDGAVTFTELGPNLTRVLLVLEYWPQGLFERTGNLWRAQGRRARLEFKHFRRHAMTHTLIHQEEVEGWRGEIRDGEVVKTHEEAMEEEQQAAEEEDTEAGERDESAEYADEGDTGEGEPEDEYAEGEAEDEYEDTDEEGGAAEDEYDEDEEAGEADEGGSGRREPARAGRR